MNKVQCIKYIDTHVRLDEDYCRRKAEERKQTVEEFIIEYLLTTKLTTTRPCASAVAQHYIDKWKENAELDRDFEFD